MGLVDRFTRRALVAAAIQILSFLGVVAYGLWAPSLGARITWPTVAILPAWAGMVWLTLTSPWEWGGLEPRLPMQRMWGYWEGGVVYGATLCIARFHAGMFQEAKEWSEELRRLPADPWTQVLSADEAQAWASDTLGYLVLTAHPHGWLWIGGALLALALAWFLLP